MENYSDEEILKVLKAYENKRLREKEHYDRKKDTEEFKKKNRANANKWYHKNKEIKKDIYQNNKDLVLAKASYNYYHKLDRVAEFEVKFPQKYKLIKENGYLKEKKPESSTSTSTSSSEAEPSQ